MRARGYFGNDFSMLEPEKVFPLSEGCFGVRIFLVSTSGSTVAALGATLNDVFDDGVDICGSCSIGGTPSDSTGAFDQLADAIAAANPQAVVAAVQSCMAATLISQLRSQLPRIPIWLVPVPAASARRRVHKGA